MLSEPAEDEAVLASNTFGAVRGRRKSIETLGGEGKEQPDIVGTWISAGMDVDNTTDRAEVDNDDTTVSNIGDGGEGRHTGVKLSNPSDR